jgi:hypothetical protein
MDEKEKEFVREYNASVKHGDPLEKLTMPDGISIKNKPRRTLIKQESDSDQSDQKARAKMAMRPHKKKEYRLGSVLKMVWNMRRSDIMWRTKTI